MKWYYVENGQQAGPVEETEFPQLARFGKLRADTLVWREGMAKWEAFSTACPQEFAATMAAPAAADPATSAGEASCAECGRVFKVEDMIHHGQCYVCASCKPVFMQKLREGVASPTAPRGAEMATLEEVLARDYRHDLGDYLGRAWGIFKGDAGLIIGATVLVYLCVFAANVIPYASFILSIVFTGPLMGGLWLFYLKKIRGSTAGVGDAFGGFGPRFGQLLLAKLIPGLLAGLCMVPVVILAVAGMLTLSATNRSGSPLGSGLGIGLISAGGMLAIAGLCGAIYLSTCWIFTLPLVADKGMGFWPAMSLSRSVVIKHWWMTLLVVIVLGLLGIAGCIVCLVGVLITGPVAFAAMGCAYEKLFGDLAPSRP
jgi:hypothetical protein